MAPYRIITGFIQKQTYYYIFECNYKEMEKVHTECPDPFYKN